MKGSRGTWESDAEEANKLAWTHNKHWLRQRWEDVRSNLEGEFCLALRLPPDDEDEDQTHHEDDGEGYDAPRGTTSLHRQYTEGQDQRPCRRMYAKFPSSICNSAHLRLSRDILNYSDFFIPSREGQGGTNRSNHMEKKKRKVEWRWSFGKMIFFITKKLWF